MKKINSLILIISFLFTVNAFAQLSYVQKVNSNGFRGYGAYESEIKNYIDGDRKTSETSLKFTGRFMKHFSPKGFNVEITRLDKELFWKYNTEEKKYEEITFAKMKELFEEGTADSQMPKDESQEQQTEQVDNSEYEWQQPKLNVNDTGETQNINGFNCKRYIITIETVGKHKATGILDTLLLTNDVWNSTAVGNLMLEIQEFDKKFAEKLGFTKENQMGMMQLMKNYEKQFNELTEKMKNIEGYPIKSNFSMTQTTHVSAQAANQQQVENEEEDSSVKISKPGDMIGGFLGKKAKKMMTKKEEKPTNRIEIMQVMTEITTISKEQSNPGKFEVPKGYKLKS